MLDEETSVFISEDRIIELGVAECDVLSYLIKNKNRCVTGIELAQELDYTIIYVRRIIHNLRNKLCNCLNIITHSKDIGYTIEYIGDTNDNKITTNDKTQKK